MEATARELIAPRMQLAAPRMLEPWQKTNPRETASGAADARSR
jgi:hypothetical protein